MCCRALTKLSCVPLFPYAPHRPPARPESKQKKQPPLDYPHLPLIKTLAPPQTLPPNCGADATGLRTAPVSEDGIQSFDGEDHDQDDVVARKGSLSKRMFQRAATVAHNAGVSLHVTHDRGRHEHEVDEHGIDKRRVKRRRRRGFRSLAQSACFSCFPPFRGDRARRRRPLCTRASARWRDVLRAAIERCRVVCVRFRCRLCVASRRAGGRLSFVHQRRAVRSCFLRFSVVIARPRRLPV